MNKRIEELLSLPALERLNDWASIGPVQKAALEEFTELVARGPRRKPRRVFCAGCACLVWQGQGKT